MISSLTIIAVVISGIVVLLTLGKISRQLDQLINLLKTTDKKWAVSQSKEDFSASRIQRQIDELTRELKIKKGDIDWKG
jgi:predicted PurR-regulated permease PerM